MKICKTPILKITSSLFYRPLPFYEKNMNLPFLKNLENSNAHFVRWLGGGGGGGGGGGSNYGGMVLSTKSKDSEAYIIVGQTSTSQVS